MQPLHSGIIFLPGSLKTWTWKLSPILPPTITENHKNVSKVGPRRLPKSTLKSLKLDLRAHLAPNSEKTPTDGTPNTSGVDPRGVWSDHWASRPPFGCPLGTKFQENSDRWHSKHLGGGPPRCLERSLGWSAAVRVPARPKTININSYDA